jgi:hypothetical protein
MAGPNDVLITNFLLAFNAPLPQPPTPAQIAAKVATIVPVFFCTDAMGPPSVGITSHGPNFVSVTAVTLLFNQLFTSFPDLTLTEQNGYTPRLYSATGTPTISVTTTLQGSYQSLWFSKDKNKKDKDSHFSKPLSDIAPQPKSPQTTSIPAIAIFALNVTNAAAPLITQLSVYMDRYRFEADLKPGADNSGLTAARARYVEHDRVHAEDDKKHAEHDKKHVEHDTKHVEHTHEDNKKDR